ncbi:MAG TPA: type II toxin-antitoxin system VapC family toxin [Planctomycetota bacterium]|nr:type II toxin-antitoxin system VapC family toxin [Planctomycetota bacterium]
MFWDTSALVRCYDPGESAHEHARNFLLSEKGHQGSAFLVPELVSAVVRKLGRDKRNREALLLTINEHLAYFTLSAVDEEHLDQATRLIKRYSLRAGDAVHVAAALILRKGLGKRSLAFLTADVEQAEAAREEKLKVFEL